MMLKSSDVPQDELADTHFIIHHNYAGHSEFESSMRIEVVADEESYQFLENLADLRVSEPEHQLNLEDIDWKKDEKLIKIIKLFTYIVN